MDDRTSPHPALSPSAAYLLAGGIVAASAGAWIVSLRAMQAMPATIAGFVAFWTVMMAAMMLPATLLFATVARTLRQPVVGIRCSRPAHAPCGNDRHHRPELPR